MNSLRQSLWLVGASFTSIPFASLAAMAYAGWLMLAEPTPKPNEVVVSYGQYAALVLIPFFAVHGFLFFWSIFLCISTLSGYRNLWSCTLILLANLFLFIATVSLFVANEINLWTALSVVLYGPFFACNLLAVGLALVAIGICVRKPTYMRLNSAGTALGAR